MPGGVSVQRRVRGGAAERPLLVRPPGVRRHLQARVRQERSHVHQRLSEAQSRV